MFSVHVCIDYVCSLYMCVHDGGVVLVRLQPGCYFCHVVYPPGLNKRWGSLFLATFLAVVCHGSCEQLVAAGV